MPFQQRTKKNHNKKDGRVRTSSTVSTTQAGPVEANEQSKPSPKASDPSSSEPAKKTPNVFEFLEDNDESSSESEEEGTQALTKIQSPKPRTSPVAHALLKSGGGHSPRSSFGSRSSSDSRQSSDTPATSTSENQLQLARKSSAAQSKSPPVKANSSSSSGKRQLEITRPESYYTQDMHRSPLPPSPPSSPEDSLHRDALTNRRSSASQVPSGYGLVASHLTQPAAEEKTGFPPLYRRFENLNHRVLLHLQDEIAQMEEDLQALDEYDELHRSTTAEEEGTKVVPASRRMDVKHQVYSSLHYRRMDLMSTLVQKTEQYNNALSAYSKVAQTLPRASENDIHRYRAWLKEHNPIAAPETKFLDHDADLVSLTPRLAASAAAAPVYMAIIIGAGAILLPLLAFSMIAEFSGRLVVVTVVGGAAAAIAANYSAGIETLVDSRDGWRCATLYFGFMTVAAMFIP
ncbi:hypothetical protein N7510_011138 [Penicillium lagena]|uniref:uncharacterized protein n=1 Tax=Penicillium lagena TaxID=94218 RepID=UPI00253F6D12|nr:uncharacterized protein N7510_011138 [Penicillium lagena]KAJ5601604.1 hypothetical protein N7510_011138 [Penicillium lagena]